MTLEKDEAGRHLDALSQVLFVGIFGNGSGGKIQVAIKTT